MTREQFENNTSYKMSYKELLERLEMADQDGGHEKLKSQIAFEKKCIERKLYQKPPLNSDHN